MANKSLNNAKEAKNDEFYTRMSDICDELYHYRDQFVGKKILLNCDDPEWSMFWKYFELNFDQLQLEKLTSTHYDPEQPTYKLEMTRGVDVNGDGKMDVHDIVKTPLLGNGDFSSAECIELLKEADIVVTNPPFSLFRDFITLLMEYDKKFLIIGNKNAITYKEVFPLIKENKVWLGYTSPKQFFVPDDYEADNVEIVDGRKIAKFGNICWFTNLDIKKRHDSMKIWRDYNPEEYPTYDNYDAIEVGYVADIPCDYYGVMGVPITFLDSYCPEQFEILGLSLELANPVKGLFEPGTYQTGGNALYSSAITDKDRAKGFTHHRYYARILIRRVDQPTNLSQENADFEGGE